MTSAASAVRDDIVRARIRAGLRRVLVAGERSTDVVPSLLSGLHDDERRAIKDGVFGVAVQRLRLLRNRAPSVADAAVDDDQLDDLVDRLHAPDDGPWPDDIVDRIALQRSCPRWLAARLVDSLGVDDADAFLRASNAPGPRTLRANTLVNDREALRGALADEGIVVVDNPRTPWAADVVGRANIFGCRAFREGRFEVQDASSQAVVLAADVAAEIGDGAVVVDLCAGRGGKTLALAAAMNDRGTLWVHDVDARALLDLRGRLPRARVTCTRQGLPDDGSADVVVVDAPCSSVGVLRRSPDLRYTLRPDDVVALGAVQRALLSQAARLVRPGGRVVYATCSVLRDENDDVVDAVLSSGSTPRLTVGSRTLLWPRATSDGDGFFIAVLERAR